MKRPRPARQVPQVRRTSRALLGLAIASGMLLIHQTADACDACDSGVVSCDSCDPSRSIGIPGNPIYRTLDAVAGRVEKLLAFDKCNTSGCDVGGCDIQGCDDACDAAMIHELMVPMPPTSVPAPYVDANEYGSPDSSNHSGLDAPVIMSEPVIVSPQIQSHDAVPLRTEGQSFGDYNAMPYEAETGQGALDAAQANPATPDNAPIDRLPEVTIPTPDPSPNATPPASNDNNEGSIFDTLDDPFGDDARALPQPYRTIRPSNYRPSNQQRSNQQPSNYQRSKSPEPLRLQAPALRSQTQTRRAATKGIARAAGHRSASQQAQGNQRPVANQTHVHTPAHRVTSLQPAPQPKNVMQQRSVSMMRHAVGQPHAAARLGSLPSQPIAAREAASGTQAKQVSHQHARVSPHPATHRNPASVAKPALTKKTGTNRVGTSRAATSRAVASSSAVHRHGVNRASHTHGHTHQHARSHQHFRSHQPNSAQPTPTLRPVAMPVPRANARPATGQRHSNAAYSAYGHTTNR
ncbi:MAG: hypothetical protein HKN47_04645 [Pirellulaceae bacterium]|nr:hypothetical protein [Pirellulaceae bacterium]